MNDVVVTGIGVVTPIGTGVEEFWNGLMAGRSGARPLEGIETDDLSVRIGCPIDDFDPTTVVSAREAARMDRFTQMAVVAADLAWRDAGWDKDEIPFADTGVIVGSGIGGLATIEREHRHLLDGGPRRVSPFTVPKLMPNGGAAAIAMRFGLLGPNFAPTSACATGAHALGEACMWLESGRADVMLAGGSEAAITRLAISAFARMGALSTRNDDPERASRPFDRQRDGFVAAEGAGILVLERADVARRRGARIRARITGYGASADAHHVTQPDPEGRGARAAMQRALADAGIRSDDVDYINAHGTSTPYNDRIETIAIKEAFGVEAKRIAVSSTKSQMGHLLGAAGAVEAAVCALAVERGIVPGTINLDDPDPECDLDYVPEGPREMEVSTALSNSFGFGGQNASLVIARA